MAGYFEFSKSNNAIEAENDGKYPATILAKRLGVKPAAIRAFLSPCEWHHTSKHYNATEYFSEEAALEIIGQLKGWREQAKAQTIYENCSGSYLVWSGTRNHPHATAVNFSGIKAVKKGKWFTLHLPSGDIRKGEDTRGFILYDGGGRRLTFNS